MSADQPISNSTETHPRRRHSAHSELLQGPHFAPTAKSQPEDPMPLRLKERMARLMRELEAIEYGTDQQTPETGQEFIDQLDASEAEYTHPEEEVVSQIEAAVTEEPQQDWDSYQSESDSIEEIDATNSEPLVEEKSVEPVEEAVESVETSEPLATDEVPEENDQPATLLRDVSIDPEAMQPLSQVLESAQFMDQDRWREAYTDYPDAEEIPEYRNWNSQTADTSAEPGQEPIQIEALEEIASSETMDEEASTVLAQEINSPEIVGQDEEEHEKEQSAMADFQLQASMILQELRSQQESLTSRRKQLDERQQSMDSQNRLERLKVSEKAREILQRQKELESAEKRVLDAEYQSLLEAEKKEQTEAAVEVQSDLVTTDSPEADVFEVEVSSAEENQDIVVHSDQNIENINPILPDLEFALAVKRHVESMEDAPDNPIFIESDIEDLRVDESASQQIAEDPQSQVVDSDGSASSQKSTIPMDSFESQKDQQEVLAKEQQLRKQHSLAVQSMQQQKRRLQLLRSILSQQQEDWGTRVDQLETERMEWSLHLQAAKENWVNQRQEGERFAVGQQVEIDQQGEMQKQREASLISLEKKLNEAQIQVFRDQTLVKQISRAARKTLSNNDWAELKENIAREAEDFLSGVENQAREIHFQTVQHQQRLEKRQEELEAYRQNTQKWVERQNKLLSRRAAHLEQREEEVQAKLKEVAEARRDLLDQQNQLNEILNIGLEQIEDEISGIDEQGFSDAA